MCRIRNCKRHEYNAGLCLTHLREAIEAGIKYNELSSWTPKDTRKPKEEKVTIPVESIDSIEVTTTDDTTEMEKR